MTPLRSIGLGSVVIAAGTGAHPGSSNAATSVQHEIRVRLKPLGSEWMEGEPVLCAVVVENSTNTTLRIHPYELQRVTVSKEGGKPASLFASRGFICWNGMTDVPDIVVEPGTSTEEIVRIETDPLGATGGVRMVPGKYSLSFPGFASVRDLTPVVTSASITVKPHSDYAIGDRIVFIGFGADRVSVIREDGDAQSFALDDGRQLARAALGDMTPLYPALDAADFSTDGKWIGRVMLSSINPRGFSVQVTHLAEGAFPRIFELDRTEFNDGVPWMRGLNPNCGVAWIATSSGVFEMSLTNGAVTPVSAWTSHADVSPDGQFCIHGAGPTAVVQNRDGTAVAGPWPGPDGCRVLGKDGVYGTLPYESLVWRSFDGRTSRSFPGAGHFAIAESADGSLVASGNPVGADFRNAVRQLMIHTTCDQRLLWTLDDGKDRIVGFTSAPFALVAATVQQRGTSAFWISDTIEIFEANTGRLLRSLTLPASEHSPAIEKGK